jgi:hypothetical protein
VQWHPFRVYRGCEIDTEDDGKGIPGQQGTAELFVEPFFEFIGLLVFVELIFVKFVFAGVRTVLFAVFSATAGHRKEGQRKAGRKVWGSAGE